MKGALRNKGPPGSAAAVPRPFNQRALSGQDFRRKPGHPPGPTLELRNKAGGVATTRWHRSSPNLLSGSPIPTKPRDSRSLLHTGRPDPDPARRRRRAPAPQWPRNPRRDTVHHRPASQRFATLGRRRPPRGLRSEWARPSAAGAGGDTAGGTGTEPAGVQQALGLVAAFLRSVTPR